MPCRNVYHPLPLINPSTPPWWISLCPFTTHTHTHTHQCTHTYTHECHATPQWIATSLSLLDTAFPWQPRFLHVRNQTRGRDGGKRPLLSIHWLAIDWQSAAAARLLTAKRSRAFISHARLAERKQMTSYAHELKKKKGGGTMYVFFRWASFSIYKLTGGISISGWKTLIMWKTANS